MSAELKIAAAAGPRRLFYWFHTTSRQHFETGIQRVARRLGNALGQGGYDVIAVGREEGSGLVEVIGRGAAAFEAALGSAGERPLLFIPELTADLVARGIDPICMGRAYGMRTMAFVHDTIPLKLREHYTSAAVAMFEAYFESFARTDAVLATTPGTAHELAQFLRDRGLRVPPIDIVPLPAQFGDEPRVTSAAPARRPDMPLKLVTVGSWERRKNLPRLLRALERVRREAVVDLTLVGRQGFDKTFDAEVAELLDAMTGVTIRGPLSDVALAALIAASHATVYPSWMEGFGLPVGESLWLGRPCLCHLGSAMAELPPRGGTLTIDMTDEGAIADALLQLACEPEFLTRLGAEALDRPLVSWRDYAAAVGDVLAR